MSAQACLACGRARDLERHHVAGWRNDADLVVGLCAPCHRFVTGLQHAAGVNLEAGPRVGVDIARATLVGAAHLLELFLLHHPEFSKVATRDVRTAGRVASAGLDLMADFERPGRKTPDSRLRVETSVRPACADPVRALAEWTRFVGELERILSSEPLTTACRSVAARLRTASAADLAVALGALAVALGSAGRLARETASRVDAQYADLAIAAAIGSLCVMARLQDLQRGRY